MISSFSKSPVSDPEEVKRKEREEQQKRAEQHVSALKTRDVKVDVPVSVPVVSDSEEAKRKAQEDQQKRADRRAYDLKREGGYVPRTKRRKPSKLK